MVVLTGLGPARAPSKTSSFSDCANEETCKLALVKIWNDNKEKFTKDILAQFRSTKQSIEKDAHKLSTNPDTINLYIDGYIPEKLPISVRLVKYNGKDVLDWYFQTSSSPCSHDCTTYSGQSSRVLRSDGTLGDKIKLYADRDSKELAEQELFLDTASGAISQR